ncbi:hypothetical protein CW751_10125 [Brumimicrobium salinarum]|uniref:Secretion system C-terminal sorting domain-containing protein n=1 Tax=Brumimicrobium salinarum TaxID=2058658 RepID=A0A2I0R1H0_9FLAO|nr:T9SS type A sorting domain-containing protein [Brumimicrobium salinarum]PKR80417.1 hypothetical protein CW751_10125 [Brumimicrobium salinarum]
MEKILTLLITCCFFATGFNQSSTEALEKAKPNLTTINEQSTYPKDIAAKYNQMDYSNHPDFGVLPKDEFEGYFEVLDKRTETSRFFRSIDNPNKFYITKSNVPLHYEKDGFLRAINPYLYKDSEGIYIAKNQNHPTILDVHNLKTGIKGDENTLYFNNFKLHVLYLDGSSEVFNANWDDRTIGNEGIYITNVFPNMDLEIVYKQSRIKSTFKVKEKMPNISSAQLIDQLSFEEQELNLNFFKGDTIDNSYYGSIGVGGSIEQPDYIYSSTVVYDNSANRSHTFHLPYTINNSNHQIITQIDEKVLNNDTLTYPVSIDPTVEYGWFSALGNKFSIEQIPYYCSRSLSLIFPGGATPTDFSTQWELHTGRVCQSALYQGWLSDANVWITSSCGSETPVGGGISGSTVYGWLCSGCDDPGPWSPTLPFNIGEEQMVTCYPPSCNDQIMSFDFNITGTNNYSQCLCQQFNPSNNSYESNIVVDGWAVRVQGRTLETLGNPLTGNGNATIAPVSCSGGNVTLDPTPEYGVPGYSYSWSTGASTPTISIPPYPYNGQTVTANVTDACGTVRTAQFQIQCPLAVSLTAFNVENLGKSVLLEWTTETETDNDYFQVYRSQDGKEFKMLEKVKGAGNSNQTLHYQFKDERPLLGVSYYKLGIVDMDGNTEYTDIKTVQRNSETETIQLIPNPANEKVAIAFAFPTDAKYEVKIIDALGKEKFVSNKEFKKGMQTINVNTKDFSNGVYTVLIVTKNNVNSARLIIN